MSQKVTMQRLADHLGVSKFVVSRALSGKKGVSLSTRDRVLRLATQMGYFTNNNVRLGAPVVSASVDNEETPAKQNVMVLMPNIRFQTKDSSYWGRILEGISIELEKLGYGMVIITDNTVEQLVTILNPQGFMGMIGVGMISTQLLLEVHRLGIPIVLVDHEDPLVPSDTLFVHNYELMGRMTDYLIGLGHSQIRFIGSIQYARSFRERWLGFRDRMEERGICTPGDDWVKPLEDKDDLKKCRIMPTAFVCANDALARDAMGWLGEMGLSVPHDVTVVGFDNIQEAAQLKPPMTTVHTEKEYMGRRAVEMLIWRLNHKSYPMERLLVSGQLVIRESAAAPKTVKVQG